MKLGEIKQVKHEIDMMESTSNDARLILESAANMVRSLRTRFHTDNEVKNVDSFWTTDVLAKFCAALEHIEAVVSKQISSKTLNNQLRDTVFSILMTADFDDKVVIQKILKQADKQQALVNKWKELTSDVAKFVPALDTLARDVSSTAALLRTKGAQTIAPKASDEVADNAVTV
jgi:hypothetical protein